MTIKGRWRDRRLEMYESTWPYEGVPVGSQVVLYDDFITPITAHTADAAVMNSAVPWNFGIVNGSTLTDVNVAGARHYS